MQVLGSCAGITGPLAPYAQVDRARAGNGCWVMASMAGGLDGPAAISGRAGALSTGSDAALSRRMRVPADVVLAGVQTVRREGYRGIGLPREQAAARQAAARQAAGRPAVPLMGTDPLPAAVSPPGASLRHVALRHVLRDGGTLFLRYERGQDE